MATIFRLGLWLAQFANQRVALGLSRRIAGLLLLCRTDVAHVTRTNLATCFPEHDAQALHELCRESLTQLVLLFFEFAQLAHWSKTKLLDQIVDIQGKALLDAAYQSERGVVLLVPHFGNWELLCAFLGAHYSYAALYDPPKIAAFEAVILGARSRFSGDFFAIDTAGMRNLLRVLKGGKLVAILPDQVPQRNAGVYADFFATPALTMTLTHRLISKNQAVPLVGSVERVTSELGFSYRLCFETIDADLTQTDAATCAQIINGAIERVVRRAPAQYQWEYKRFKRPAGIDHTNIYRRQ